MTVPAMTGWVPPPWFALAPPQTLERSVSRPELVKRLDSVVRRHRIVDIAAPSGYGKTTLVGQWAAQAEIPVAWLTLTRFDHEVARLVRGVISAFQELADFTASERLEPLLGLSPDIRDVAGSYDALGRTVSMLDEELALVIDDRQFGRGAINASIIGALLEHGPSNLRLVLVGTDQLDVPVAHRLERRVGRIGPTELAFTPQDVAQAAARLQGDVTPQMVEDIWQSTGGWPAAVHLTLLGLHSRGPSDDPLDAPTGESAGLTDYVAEVVLRGLDPALLEFVLASTTCSIVDARVAAALCGSDASTAAARLEDCVRRGLFLDRLGSAGSEPVYRWHAVFADQCRRVLTRRDPAEVERLNRVAAEALAATYPLEAIVLALRARDPELAVGIITTRWIGLVIESNGNSLDRMCRQLPEPWASRPDVLLVRACCLDVDGERRAAALTFKRAVSGLDAAGHTPSSEQEFNRAVAELMLADGHEALMTAADSLTSLLERAHWLDRSRYAQALFLLGWTELRLRRRTADAIELLRSAIRECDAVGDAIIAHRARANLCFAYAFGGVFVETTALLDGSGGTAIEIDEWQSFDGGAEAMAAGFVAYYRNQIDDAAALFQRLVDGGGGGASYAALARVYLAFIAAASDDSQRRSDAERELQKVSDSSQHGMPWGLYKRYAAARLAAARGDVASLLALAGDVEALRYAPVTAVLLADSLWRAGHHQLAGEVLTVLDPDDPTSYVSAMADMVRAVIEWHGGNAEEAHRLIERSLDTAVPQGIALPYAGDNLTLRELLVEHAVWGTHHEGFLASRIAYTEASVSRSLVFGSRLSRREHEVLGFMRTSMTTADIAGALYVSVNTVKTHQRAVYRKLGVTNRRDAVRLRV